MHTTSFRMLAVLVSSLALVGINTGRAAATVHYPGSTTFHFHDFPSATGDFFNGVVSSSGPLACTKNRGVQVLYGTVSSPGTQVGGTVLTNPNGHWSIPIDDPNTPVQTGSAFYARVDSKTLNNGNVCKTIFSAFKSATGAFMTDQ
jgi:hypothetical protein